MSSTTGAAGRRGRGSAAAQLRDERPAPRTAPEREETAGEVDEHAGRPTGVRRGDRRARVPAAASVPAASAASTASTGMSVASTLSSRSSTWFHSDRTGGVGAQDGVPQVDAVAPPGSRPTPSAIAQAGFHSVRVDELGHAPADGLLEGLAARDGLRQRRLPRVPPGPGSERARQRGIVGRQVLCRRAALHRARQPRPVVEEPGRHGRLRGHCLLGPCLLWLCPPGLRRRRRLAGWLDPAAEDLGRRPHAHPAHGGRPGARLGKVADQPPDPCDSRRTHRAIRRSAQSPGHVADDLLDRRCTDHP